jgi:enoyl-CoA hydratase
MALLAQEAAGDGVAVLRMSNGKANVMDTALSRELADAWRALAADDAVRAVVVTGTGSIFSAGVDLVTLLEGGEAYLDDFLPALSDMLAGAFRFPKPMVAAVNGHAIAGGCVLACAADRRYMVDGKARIGVPEVLVGVPFPLAGLEIIKFVAAPKQLSTLVFGGGTYLAEEAVRQGFTDEVTTVDDLMPQALAAATRLAAIPPTTFRVTKAELRHDGLARIDHDMDTSDKEVRAIWASDECRAAIGRYVEQTLGKKP